MTNPDAARTFMTVVAWLLLIVAPLEFLVSALIRLTNQLQNGNYSFNGSIYGIFRESLSVLKTFGFAALLLFLAKHGWKNKS